MQQAQLTLTTSREDLTRRYAEATEKLKSGTATQADFQALLEDVTAFLANEVCGAALDRNTPACRYLECPSDPFDDIDAAYGTSK